MVTRYFSMLESSKHSVLYSYPLLIIMNSKNKVTALIFRSIIHAFNVFGVNLKHIHLTIIKNFFFNEKKL
jgi:hypothetical protein